jgi:hypothetical protein
MGFEGTIIYHRLTRWWGPARYPIWGRRMDAGFKIPNIHFIFRVTRAASRVRSCACQWKWRANSRQKRMISGLHEVVKEVVTARLAANEALLFDARVTAIDDLKQNRPVIRYRTGQDGDERAIECGFIAGCGASQPP